MNPDRGMTRYLPTEALGNAQKRGEAKTSTSSLPGPGSKFPVPGFIDRPDAASGNQNGPWSWLCLPPASGLADGFDASDSGFDLLPLGSIFIASPITSVV